MHWPDLPPDAPSFRLRVTAGAVGVTLTRVAWESLVRLQPVSPRSAYQVEMVLEELLMNVALHGHDDGRPHDVDVAVALAPDAVHVAVRDDGRHFDPGASPVGLPDQDALGGRGLGIVRRAVREWRYARVAGCNLQHLVIARG